MPHLLRKTRFCAPFVATALLVGAPAATSAEGAAKLELGKRVFTTESEPSCAICHALADAGAAGALGPNLDELKPAEDRVRAAVVGGVGVMPAFAETLSEEQIDAVAHYVASAVGQSQ